MEFSGLLPPQWRVARFLGELSFPAGAHITNLVGQSAGIITALAVDSSGRPNVIFLDQNVQPVQWRVHPIGEATFPAGAHITDLVRQSDGILAALAMDSSARPNVMWLQ
jgi:hypothetical protein